MKPYIRALWNGLCKKSPFILRRHYREATADLRGLLRDNANEFERQREEAVERAMEKARRLVEHCSDIQWHRDRRDGRYTVCVSLDIGMCRGTSPWRDELAYIAREVGRRVERDIATGHFIQQARESAP